MNKLTRTVLALASSLSLVLAGCAQDNNGGPSNVIDYWLWDSAQQPGYQKCADRFSQENPGLSVRITQMGWDDYWSKLTAGFIADQAPDVFTNHLAKYAQFVDLGVLLPLDELPATKDINPAEFQKGLPELWVGQDGHRYGAPKDWDTVAYFYDKKKVEAAGLTERDLQTMTWNPDDGGTFEKVIARLTVDKNGRRGDQPGFDKTNVAVYGIGTNAAGGDNFGQTQWAPYSGALGWNPTDKNPWGTHFAMDDSEFQKAIGWYFGLADKGYMPGASEFAPGTGGYSQFAAGRAAMALDGSWMVSSYSSIKNVDLRLAPTPVGPSGHRSSPFNGLADSITRFTDNRDAASKWVAFLASDTCQNIIGDAAVVFPARKQGSERSVAARRKAGLDVSAFTVHVDNGTTQLLPVVRNAADLYALTRPAFDAIYIGSKQPSDLTGLNNQVNKLFEVTDR